MHPRNTKNQMCKILILGATSFVANGVKDRLLQDG